MEFCYFRDVKKVHPLDKLCNELNILHKRIKPRTPRHNGKVERSHRYEKSRVNCAHFSFALDFPLIFIINIFIHSIFIS